MKIEITPDEVLALLTGANNAMVEKIRLIADGMQERRENEMQISNNDK